MDAVSTSGTAMDTATVPTLRKHPDHRNDKHTALFPSQKVRPEYWGLINECSHFVTI
jgi:hypothetical protein